MPNSIESLLMITFSVSRAFQRLVVITQEDSKWLLLLFIVLGPVVVVCLSVRAGIKRDTMAAVVCVLIRPSPATYLWVTYPQGIISAATIGLNHLSSGWRQKQEGGGP